MRTDEALVKLVHSEQVNGLVYLGLDFKTPDPMISSYISYKALLRFCTV